MKGVLSWVVVVENDFDDLILIENKLICVGAVDFGVSCVWAC